MISIITTGIIGLDPSVYTSREQLKVEFKEFLKLMNFPIVLYIVYFIRRFQQLKLPIIKLKFIYYLRMRILEGFGLFLIIESNLNFRGITIARKLILGKCNFNLY